MKLTPSEYFAMLRHDLYSDFTPTTALEFGCDQLSVPIMQEGNLRIEFMKTALGERRLVINVPPRSLKSHCATVAFPAFVLAHNPSAQIIAASYGTGSSEQARHGLPHLAGQ